MMMNHQTGFLMHWGLYPTSNFKNYPQIVSQDSSHPSLLWKKVLFYLKLDRGVFRLGIDSLEWELKIYYFNSF